MRPVLPAMLCIYIASLLWTQAGADLRPRLGGLAIYDTDLNITWLADAGGAGSPRGLMTWADAQLWAESFTLGIATQWRLPATVNPDASCKDAATSSGLNCTGSEMGHLFYVELSGIAGQPVDNSVDPDLDLFSNLKGANWWSGTTFTIPEFAWDFRFANGRQGASNKSNFMFFAWPVHDGDVFAVDSDKDGVADDSDNCLLDANTDQRDTDGDGIGNFCDGDFNQDCAQNFPDLAIMASQFFIPGDTNTDMNGDSATNFIDLERLRSVFFNPPGPSGIPNDCD